MKNDSNRNPLVSILMIVIGVVIGISVYRGLEWFVPRAIDYFTTSDQERINKEKEGTPEGKRAEFYSITE